MLAKSVLLASFAVLALADPIPAPAPQATDDLSSLLAEATSAIGTDYSSLLGQATAALGALSDIPTLPASVQSVLATAIPSSELTKTDFACIATATPAWYNNLPNDAKSAISSYETAFASWYSKHSSELAFSTNVPAPCAAATSAGTTSTKSSGSAGATTTTAGAKASSSTAAGTAAAAGTSKAAAPRATSMAASIAGLAGVLGFMVAL